MRGPVEIAGLPVHPLTMAESVATAERLIAQGGSHQHVVLNAAKVVMAHDDPELARIIRGCSLVNADGQSVVWGLRLLGADVPERVAGIDFMHEMWRSAARNGYGVYLLGAQADTVATVATVARGQGVQVVGYRDGFWLPDEEDGVVARVREAEPDILFLAVPSPRKEAFLAHRLDALGVKLAVGVGGSFDVVAGKTRRAPIWMQRAGLEWAYRLGQEPRRMFRRYMVGNCRFLALLARQWAGRRRLAGPG